MVTASFESSESSVETAVCRSLKLHGAERPSGLRSTRGEHFKPDVKDNSERSHFPPYPVNLRAW